MFFFYLIHVVEDISLYVHSVFDSCADLSGYQVTSRARVAIAMSWQGCGGLLVALRCLVLYITNKLISISQPD
jgi:hypothetical protein